MKERTQIILKLITVQFVLPGALILSAWLVRPYTRLLFLPVQTVLCLIFLSGYWEFFSRGLKYGFFLISEVCLLLILVHGLTIRDDSDHSLIPLLAFAVIQLYLLMQQVKVFIVMIRKTPEHVNIDFPLRNGTYLITDGGDSKISRLMNYHFYSRIHRKKDTYRSMRFATDIVKITPRHERPLPEQNDQYPVFGENIYSPMGGMVVKVEDGIRDNLPFSGKYPYNTGNTVVIRNGNCFCLLGHLQNGSILAREGEEVSAGDLIARAGNSGFSERPHLHMQLIRSESENFWSGNGICIRYDGRNLYKNRRINIS
jgi:hypothetical protein